VTGASSTPWVAIDRRECIDLLETAAVGRLAITVNALPTILPVAIEMRETNVVLRFLLGSRIPVRSNQVVALEAGNFEDADGGPWTVVVQGMLTREQAESESPASSGVAAPRFQLSTELVSGWRSEPIFEPSWTHARERRAAAMS